MLQGTWNLGCPKSTPLTLYFVLTQSRLDIVNDFSTGRKLKKNISAKVLTICLFLTFLSLIFLGNFRFVQLQPGGTDFLYRWLPTKLALLEGNQNPYNEKATLAVEQMHYGRPHQAGETPGIFAYPYYTLAVFAPFALVESFPLARALWMTLMEVCHITIIFLTIRILKLDLKPTFFIFMIFFALFNANMAQALIDGNVASLAALFAVLALFCISNHKDRWGGVFLALSSVKPQMIVLFIPFVVLWAFSQKRWNMILYSALGFMALLGFSFVFFPGWLSAFFHQLITYTDVASPSTPRAILSYWMNPSLAGIFAWVLTGVSLILIITAWVCCYGKDFQHFFWAACLTFTLMPLTGITSAKSNYVAMLPGIILVLSVSFQRWKLRSWQWVTMVLLMIVGSWVSFWAGRKLYIGDIQLYFIDFYPMLLWLVPGLLIHKNKFLFLQKTELKLD
jgi:hypothetical protein